MSRGKGRRKGNNSYIGILIIFGFMIYAKLKSSKFNVNPQDAQNSIWGILIIITVLIVLYFLGLYLIRILKRNIRRQKYLNSTLALVDQMSGKQFEEFLEAHFHKLGYHTQLTKDSHDYGADLILKNDREVLVVQAKRYSGKIGIAAVQQIAGAKGYYGADRMLVVTNSYFTSAAINLAKSNGVELWDRNDINKKFNIDAN